MDLTKDPTDPEVEEERLVPEMTFNPALQYFGQVVSHRITHPEAADLPPLNENIAEYVKPDKELFQAAAEDVSAFESAFKLEYNNEDENKKRQRVYWRDIIQREEAKTKEEAKNIEEEERIARMKGEGKDPFGKDENEVKEISSVDPIGDFEKMTGDRKVDRLDEALPQMMSLIERFVKNSLKGDLYGKAIDCIAAMRKVCVRDDEAGKYNEFMRRIKRVFSRGSYKEFFTMLQQAAMDGLPVTLITQKESSISSNVSHEEAQKFLQNDDEPELMEAGAQKKKPAEDDLMDDIE